MHARVRRQARYRRDSGAGRTRLPPAAWCASACQRELAPAAAAGRRRLHLAARRRALGGAFPEAARALVPATATATATAGAGAGAAAEVSCGHEGLGRRIEAAAAAYFFAGSRPRKCHVADYDMMPTPAPPAHACPRLRRLPTSQVVLPRLQDYDLVAPAGGGRYSKAGRWSMGGHENSYRACRGRPGMCLRGKRAL